MTWRKWMGLHSLTRRETPTASHGRGTGFFYPFEDFQIRKFTSFPYGAQRMDKINHHKKKKKKRPLETLMDSWYWVKYWLLTGLRHLSLETCLSIQWGIRLAGWSWSEGGKSYSDAPLLTVWKHGLKGTSEGFHSAEFLEAFELRPLSFSSSTSCSFIMDYR